MKKIIDLVMKESFAGDNKYYKVKKGFDIWVETGKKKPGGYYGAAQVFSRVYKKKKVNKDDELHMIAGGNFYIEKGKSVAIGMRFSEPKDSSFEKNTKERYAKPPKANVEELDKATRTEVRYKS